jgi:hypothetical protein
MMNVVVVIEWEGGRETEIRHTEVSGLLTRRRKGRESVEMLELRFGREGRGKAIGNERVPSNRKRRISCDRRSLDASRWRWNFFVEWDELLVTGMAEGGAEDVD